MSDAPVVASDSVVSARAQPAEALRLLGEYRDFHIGEGKTWADLWVDSLRRKVEDGSFEGRLWFGPKDDAIGLAGWETAGRLGRRGWIFLTEGYRSREALNEFLRRLEADPTNSLPFLSLGDDVPGISEGDRAAVFSARGFTSVVRADMRFPAGVDPPPVEGFGTRTARALGMTDEPWVADLLRRVYAGSPERALFATSRDEEEDARQGAHEILHDGVGRWLPEASFGIADGDRLIAFTLANDFHGALISEVGVDPRFRRQGLARGLLPLTIRALRSAGFPSPRLVVTMWNERAVRLYRSVGFEFVPGGDGRVWLHLPSLGLSPPA
jgi:ribosomal protein S18 acetylase RimI-like enzyme